MTVLIASWDSWSIFHMSCQQKKSLTLPYNALVQADLSMNLSAGISGLIVKPHPNVPIHLHLPRSENTEGWASNVDGTTKWETLIFANKWTKYINAQTVEPLYPRWCLLTTTISSELLIADHTVLAVERFSYGLASLESRSQHLLYWTWLLIHLSRNGLNTIDQSNRDKWRI
jgi:hypothetical protein